MEHGSKPFRFRDGRGPWRRPGSLLASVSSKLPGKFCGFFCQGTAVLAPVRIVERVTLSWRCKYVAAFLKRCILTETESSLSTAVSSGLSTERCTPQHEAASLVHLK